MIGTSAFYKPAGSGSQVEVQHESICSHSAHSECMETVYD